ncbi:MAG: phosphate signaling complex protein PhoU [Methanosarcinales archaeon]|jgi:phosphate transport system protein|nr:phosphate signaling complex protein PhoU [Methanosarcinales archaeon]
MMRKSYNKELKEMRDEVIQMGDLVLKIFNHSSDTFFDKEPVSAEKLEKMVKKLETIEKGIEKMAASIITLQQPVAKDTREIICAVRIAMSWLKIGSHIADIYEYSDTCPEKIKNNPRERDVLKTIKAITHEMLIDAADAYKSRDTDKASIVAKKDDEVDLIFEEIRRDIIKENDTTSFSLCSLMIVGHIERIGDHIANICEDIIYLERYEIVRLN